MENRVIRDRAMRRGSMRGRDRRMEEDMRNPYGSRGGYVSSSRRSRGHDRAMDMRNDYPKYDSRYNDYNYQDSNYSRNDMHYEQPREYRRPMEYEMYGVGGMRPMMNDYNYDYRRSDYGYDYADSEKEYKEDLEEWCEKLKKFDRFGLPKEEIINQARTMGARFEDYNEKEFYVTYLMMLSDYPEAFGNYQGYIALAKGFLDDQDAKLKGSEKLACYMYKIVKGEE